MNPDQKPNQPDDQSINTDEALADVLHQYAPAEQQERAVQEVKEREERALRDALGHLPEQQEQTPTRRYENAPEQQQMQQEGYGRYEKVAPVIPPVYEPRDLREDADEQRGVLLDEFFAFIMERRHQAEFRVWSLTRRLRELQPFLEARIEESEREVDLSRPPTDPHRQRVLVAPVVYEYGVAAAALGQVQARLDLLNTHYFDAMENRSEFYIDITPTNQRDVRQLWEWFMDERDAVETDEEATKEAA